MPAHRSLGVATGKVVGRLGAVGEVGMGAVVRAVVGAEDVAGLLGAPVSAVIGTLMLVGGVVAGPWLPVPPSVHLEELLPVGVQFAVPLAAKLATPEVPTVPPPHPTKVAEHKMAKALIFKCCFFIKSNPKK